MKNEAKIRKLLGNDYHLNTQMEFNENTCNLEVTSWKLYKKYNDIDVFFSEDNKALLTSENATEEDLLEFLKKHHRIDRNEIWTILMMCAGVFLTLAVIVFFENKTAYTYFIGIEAGFLLSGIIVNHLLCKNDKVDFLEDLEWYKRRIKKDSE